MINRVEIEHIEMYPVMNILYMAERYTWYFEIWFFNDFFKDRFPIDFQKRVRDHLNIKSSHISHFSLLRKSTPAADPLPLFIEARVVLLLRTDDDWKRITHLGNIFLGM